MFPQNAQKKTKQSVPIKNRKFFVETIDTVNLGDIERNWGLNSAQTVVAKNTSLQAISSPPNKSQLNVKSVRNLSQHSKKGIFDLSTASSTKIQSTRLLSSQLSMEHIKSKSNGKYSPRSDWAYKNSFPMASSDMTRGMNKRGRMALNGSLDPDSQSQEPKGEIIDLGISPNVKKKIHGPKKDKIMKLLQSYISPYVKTQKIPTQAVANSSVYDSMNETQRPLSGHIRRTSVAPQELDWKNVNKPTHPNFVLEHFEAYLSPYEKEEIKGFDEIYYISDLDHKLPARTERDFDDDRGDYLVVQGDQVVYQYEVIEMLGRGSFGQVVKVFDHRKKEYVALKIIRSQKKFHQQAKVEIDLLRFMAKNHSSSYNITDLKDHFIFRNHVCLIFELMSLNLYDFLKKNKFQGFHLSVIRKISIQILYALKFLKDHNIIHCDLKPENILLKQPNRTGIKLIDFGSSCFTDKKLYTYIQSRFYRSPEIILGMGYSTQIDMWSFGCLLYELYTAYPLFAGDTEHDQLLAIMEVLGIPDAEFLYGSPRVKTFFQDDLQPILVENTKGKIRTPGSLPLATILNCEDQSFLDLIQKCLIYDPEKRCTPEEALSHDWILQDLPAELKAQHMKLLAKIDENPNSAKRVSDILKEEKEENPIAKELRSNHRSVIRDTPTGPVPTEGSETEAYYIKKGGLKDSSRTQKSNHRDSSLSKDRKRGIKQNASQGHLSNTNMSTTLGGNSSTQNLLINTNHYPQHHHHHQNITKENLFTILHSTKESLKMPAKASFFTSTMKKPNTSQHQHSMTINVNRSSRFSITKKASLKQLYSPSSTNLVNLSSAKSHHRGKGSNSREEESSVGRSLLHDISSKSPYVSKKSWVYSKPQGLTNRIPGELKKIVIVQQKGSAPTTMRSPKLRNISLN